MNIRYTKLYMCTTVISMVAFWSKLCDSRYHGVVRFSRPPSSDNFIALSLRVRCDLLIARNVRCLFLSCPMWWRLSEHISCHTARLISSHACVCVCFPVRVSRTINCNQECPATHRFRPPLPTILIGLLPPTSNRPTHSNSEPIFQTSYLLSIHIPGNCRPWSNICHMVSSKIWTVRDGRNLRIHQQKCAMQFRMHRRKQDRVFPIGLAHRGRVPGATNHQLGRHPMGEPAGGTMGCPTGAGADLADRSAAADVSRLQGQHLAANSVVPFHSRTGDDHSVCPDRKSDGPIRPFAQRKP